MQSFEGSRDVASGGRVPLARGPAPEARASDAEPSEAEASDDDLMLLARAGVAGSFAALIRRHQGRALRTAYRYLRHADLAADVTQNAFVAVFRGLPQYRAQGKFSAYFYRILLNQCHAARRSARSESNALAALVRNGEVGVQTVLLRESQREVEAALAQLSTKLREVVVLRYVADLSYEEIAETLNVPLGTVKRRLFDATAKLRESMEAP